MSAPAERAGDEIRLVAVSPPCIERVNRAVYRELARQHGVRVTVVVPDRYDFGRGLETVTPVRGEDFEMAVLPMTGAHPRLRRLVGLAPLIEASRPTHVLVDGDPATMLVRQVAGPVRRAGATLWVMTNENRPRRFLREAVRAARDGRIGVAAGAALTAALLVAARRTVDRVFVISRDGVAALEAMGFAGRVHRIPLGFDPEIFHEQTLEKREETRARLGLSEPTIAFFGRVIREKGLLLLVEALSRLDDLRWQFLMDRFSTYQSGFEAELEKAIERSGLASRVVVFDAPHERIPDFMNASDVVVLPSYSTPAFKEQYGRAIAEAMACGRAVVGSTCGAIPELIADAGAVFPEGNVDALSSVLRRLLEHPDEAATLGAAAGARARAELSVVRQAEAWVSLMARDLRGRSWN